MAVQNFRVTTGMIGNFGALSDTTDQAQGSRTDGWVVAKVAAGNSAEFDAGTKLTSSFMTSGAKPTALQIGANANAFRTQNPYTGTFAATPAWSLRFGLRSTTASAQIGRIRLRIYRSVNADGSGATEITSSTLVGTTPTIAIGTAADQYSVVTWSPGLVTLNNEYLFFVVAWEITTQGGSNSSDIIMRTGFNTVTGSYFVTPDLVTSITAATGRIAAATTVRGISVASEIRFIPVGRVSGSQFVDNFNRANATSLESGMGWALAPLGGIADPVALVSNQATGSSASHACGAFHNTLMPNPDFQEVSAKVVARGNQVAVLLEYSPGAGVSDYGYIAWIGASMLLYKLDAGTLTLLAGGNLGANTFAPGDILTGRVIGTKFQMLKNGVLVGEVTDTSQRRSGYGGIWVNGTTDILDDFTVTTSLSKTVVRGLAGIGTFPIYTDLIDDFNRADGSVLAGAGAGIWAVDAMQSAGQEALISGNQLAVPRNWSHLLTQDYHGATDADLIVECVNPGTGGISFAMCALDTGGTAADALCADWNTVDGWYWTLITNGGSNSTGQTAGPAPAAGDTFWMSKRAHIFRLYRKPAGGVYTEVFPSKTQVSLQATAGRMGIALRDSTQRWDNFRGGPKTFLIGRIANPYLTERTSTISNINFGWTSTHAVAQAFKAKQSLLTEVTVPLRKLGTPTQDVIIEIQGSTAGKPNGVVVATCGTVPFASLTDSLVPFTFPVAAALTPGLDYFIVFRSPSPYNTINNYPMTGGLTGVLLEGYGYCTTGSGTDVWGAQGANSLSMTLKFGGMVKGVTPYVPPPITAPIGKVAKPEFGQPSIGFSGYWVGDTSAVQKLAQSFCRIFPFTIESLELGISGDTGIADNLIVEIHTQAGGAPSGTVLGSYTVAGNTISNQLTFKPMAGTIPGLTLAGNNTPYWIVLRRSGAYAGPGASVIWRTPNIAGDVYPDGLALSHNGTSWVVAGAGNDFGFKIKLAGDTATRVGGATPSGVGAAPISVGKVTSSLPLLDDFNRANGAIGANWSGGVVGVGGIVINGNQADSSSLGAGTVPGAAFYLASSYPTNQEASAIALGPNASGFSGVLVGGDGSAGGYLCGWQGGSWMILRHDGGGFTDIGASWVGPCVAGDMVGGRIIGNQVQVLKNGVVVVSTVDTTYRGARVGAYCGAWGNRLDDFRAGTPVKIVNGITLAPTGTAPIYIGKVATTPGQNYSPNPSFEFNTAGWGNYGATTVTRDATQSWHGGASLKCVVPAGGGGAQVWTGGGGGFSVPGSGTWVYSAYVKGTPGTTYNVINRGSFVATGGWDRVSGLYTGGTFDYFGIVTANADTFWIDGVQLEPGSTPTVFKPSNTITIVRGVDAAPAPVSVPIGRRAVATTARGITLSGAGTAPIAIGKAVAVFTPLSTLISQDGPYRQYAAATWHATADTDGTSTGQGPTTADHLANGPWTFECDMKCGASDLGAVRVLLAAYQWGAIMKGADNKIRLHVDSSEAVVAESSVAISDTNWHKIAVTRNGTAVVIMIDGVDVTTLVNTANTNNDSGYWSTIGGDWENHGKPGICVSHGGAGRIANAVIFKSVISPARLATHAATKPQVPGVTLVATGTAPISIGRKTAANLVRGVTLVPSPVSFTIGKISVTPAAPVISGMVGRLDASQLGLADGAAVNSWPNLGTGSGGSVVNSPSPVMKTGLSPTGLPVVRFTAGQGQVTDYGLGLDTDFTIAYVARMWGSTRGRILASHPTGNHLWGWWGGTMDVAHQGGIGFFSPGVSRSADTSWQMYSADGDSANTPRFFINGAYANSGSGPMYVSLYGGVIISGYDTPGSGESSDCDVSEILVFNRRLSDVERVSVENYLRTKWISGGGGGSAVRGITLSEQLAVPVAIGRKATGTTVRGITLVPGVKVVPIGKVVFKPPTLPVAPVLDDFNRADGTLGANWSGTTQFGSGLSVIRNNEFGTPAATGNSNGSSAYLGQALAGYQQLRVDLATITPSVTPGRIWLVMISDPQVSLSPGYALEITPTATDSRVSWNLWQYDTISGQNYVTGDQTPAGQGFVGSEILTFSWINGRLIFEKTVGGVTTTLMNVADNSFVPPSQTLPLYHVLRTQRTSASNQTLDNYGSKSLVGQVKGITPSGTGAVPVPIGKKVTVTTVRGISGLVVSGTAPLPVGRKISATAVRGVNAQTGIVAPIGRVAGGVAGADERMLSGTNPNSSDPGGVYSLGARFLVTENGQISHVRYWAQFAGVRTLSIWDQVTQTKLATVNDTAPGIGFREIALPTPLSVVAGKTYAVTHSFNGAFGYTLNQGNPGSIAPHLTTYVPVYTSAADSFPITGGAHNYHTDVVYHTGTGQRVGGITLAPSGAAPVPIGMVQPKGLTHQDNFNRANGAVGSDWTTVLQNIFGGGVSPTIISNEFTASADFARRTSNPYKDNARVRTTFRFATKSNAAPWIGFLNAAGSGYFVELSADEFSICWVEGTSYNTINVSSVFAYTSGAEIAFEIQGTTLRALYRATPGVGAWTTVNTQTIPGGRTYAGPWYPFLGAADTTNGNSRQDDFVAETLTPSVFGVTLAPTGIAPISIGKKASATTARGITVFAVGVAPILLGKKASATVVPGISVTGMPPQFVPIGKVTGAVSNYRNVILADTPLSYWRLGESAGAMVDEKGLNNGTVLAAQARGVTGLLTGDTDKAFQMDGGTGQGVTIGNQAVYQIGNLTLEAWIKTSVNDGTYRTIMGKQFAYGAFIRDGLLTIYEWPAAQTLQSASVADGVRHHVAVVFQEGVAGGSRAYVDGVAVGSVFTHNTNDHTTGLCIGTNAGPAQEFSGVLDDAVIYNSALSPAQIAAHYTAGITGGGAGGTTVRGITAAPSGAAPISIGKRTSTTVARGVTLVSGGAAPLPVGKRISATTTKGITVIPGGAPIPIGKKTATSVTRGITFVAGGTVPVPVGKRTATTTARGVTIIPGVVPISIGKRTPTTTVYGLTSKVQRQDVNLPATFSLSATMTSRKVYARPLAANLSLPATQTLKRYAPRTLNASLPLTTTLSRRVWSPRTLTTGLTLLPALVKRKKAFQQLGTALNFTATLDKKRAIDFSASLNFDLYMQAGKKIIPIRLASTLALIAEIKVKKQSYSDILLGGFLGVAKLLNAKSSGVRLLLATMGKANLTSADEDDGHLDSADASLGESTLHSVE